MKIKVKRNKKLRSKAFGNDKFDDIAIACLGR